MLAIWLATPLHFYMTANPAMAHGASVFTSSAFVVAWLRVRDREAASGRAWAMVGLLGGLMTVVRLQDAVLLALPVADLLWRRPLLASSSSRCGCGSMVAASFPPSSP